MAVVAVAVVMAVVVVVMAVVVVDVAVFRGCSIQTSYVDCAPCMCLPMTATFAAVAVREGVAMTAVHQPWRIYGEP